MSSLTEIDPFAPETIESPFEYYRLLRSESPVYRPPGSPFFVVSTFDLAHEVVRDRRRFSSQFSFSQASQDDHELNAILEKGWRPESTLLTADPPEHDRYRRLVGKAFSARRVQQLEPSIREIAATLLDTFASRGRVELVREFAVPLPLTVIADALGVPRSDLPSFKRWSDASVAPFNIFLTRDDRLQSAREVVEFQHYFAARIEERRTTPADDIVSSLVHAHIDEENRLRPLDIPEILSILQQILVAGNETTTNLISSAVMLLLQNPDEMRRVVASSSKITNMVEEALRLESPVQGLFRIATTDTVLGDTAIPQGSQVLVLYAAANRDDAEFEDADRFVIDRTNGSEHMAFGHGVHYCLGAALARLEGKVAIELLLSRLPDLRFADDKNAFTHEPSLVLRGLRELHLEFTPS